MESGYFTQPSVMGKNLVFVCEDDLWLVSINGGTARKIVNSRSFIKTPSIDPKGEFIAFCALDDCLLYTSPSPRD